ncbi:hypothetical protein CEP52_005083 [Fusarium oligoseptatum]|uniref:Uncharacterized protein n=1 Tax=Fusarium oligoseptatum TaxID=2604345 RepID=A0A428U0E6_9HYPO|nr:hypothetical protein CEP52_005083 [Fusarium oligoseptatum]
MSLTEIRNAVLLFSNPVWSGASTVPSTIIRNLTALSQKQMAYEERITSNITTLTSTNADSRSSISGLLYVPDLDGYPECDQQQYEFIPEKCDTTRKPTSHKLQPHRSRSLVQYRLHPILPRICASRPHSRFHLLQTQQLFK